MINLTHNHSDAAKPRRMLLSIAALSAVIAAAAGIAASQGQAAPPGHDGPPTPPGHERFEHPKVEHGVLTIKGTKGDDTIVLRVKAGRPDILQVDVGDARRNPFNFERNDVTQIAVDAGDGNDAVSIDETNGVFTDTIPTTLDGGEGNDNLAGGSGAETLIGSGGDDSIDGNRGADTALMGAGDDTFTWDPGDGSDVLEGQDGNDTMVFNGAAAAEQVDVSANGSRLRFFRNPANITMDTAGMETVTFNALGGADQINVDDLTGTGVSKLNLDLAASPGGTTGDGQTDHVTVNSTAGDDFVAVSGDANGVLVAGLSAQVAVQHQDPTDQLVVNGLGGSDSITAAALAAGSVALTLDGGAGSDRIAGGPGVEKSIGGDGNDSIDGNGGADTALMGTGDDTFFWDPGDGSDVLEGQDGNDTMVFNGAAAAEQVNVSANGSRLTFFRNPGNITMDTAGIENVTFNALGGADQITVNDLTGTGVSRLNLDLAASLGGAIGDGQSDHITVNGTGGDDAVAVSGDATGVNVTGLATAITIRHAEAANDRLDVNTLAGTDTVSSGGLGAGLIQLFVDGVLVP
jgi:Ca2+-binding RTX toxin-like protein